MNMITTLFKRELRSYFATPVAYVFIVIFLVLSSAFTFYLGQFYERGQADLLPFFNFLPWLYLFLVPAVAMRLWSEERKSGTIELLLTSPLTDWEIVLGKFFGAFALYALMLGLSALNLLWLFAYGDPEVAPIVTGYLGLLLLGGGFIAIGLFLSNLTRNQIVAGLLTYAVLLMLLLVAWVGEGAGPIGKAFVSALSVFQHFEDFSKGVIDTQHVIYYLSVIAFGLFLTARSVDADRWRG